MFLFFCAMYLLSSYAPSSYNTLLVHCGIPTDPALSINPVMLLIPTPLGDVSIATDSAHTLSTLSCVLEYMRITPTSVTRLGNNSGAYLVYLHYIGTELGDLAASLAEASSVANKEGLSACGMQLAFLANSITSIETDGWQNFLNTRLAIRTVTLVLQQQELLVYHKELPGFLEVLQKARELYETLPYLVQPVQKMTEALNRQGLGSLDMDAPEVHDLCQALALLVKRSENVADYPTEAALLGCLRSLSEYSFQDYCLLCMRDVLVKA